MSQSPLYKARQTELAKRNSAKYSTNASMNTAPQEELAVVQEEVKQKAKKKAEPEVVIEPEIVELEIAVEPETIIEFEIQKEVFPPVLENKALDGFEVKEENEEIL